MARRTRTAQTGILRCGLSRRSRPRRARLVAHGQDRSRLRHRDDHQRRDGAAPDQGRGRRQLRHHHGQGVQLRRGAAAARGEGHLELPADGRPHGPARHQRLGRLEPDDLRQRRLQSRQGVEDAGRQGFQARARADRRPDRDARRLCRRQHPHRLGHARHAAALPRGPAQGLAGHAARLPADRLVQRRRRHRRPRERSRRWRTCAARRSCSPRTRRRTSSC